MTGRSPAGNPQTVQRAQALIAGYLKRHSRAVAALGPVPEPDPNSEPAREPGRDPVRDRAPARPGDYPVYAVHLANHASRLCAALLPEPMGDDALFAFACGSLGEGLGIGPQDAAERMVRVLLETPHNTDGSDLDETQIRALPKDALRWILIMEIAQRDGEFVLEAFRRGDATADPSTRDIEPLAALLGLPGAKAGG
ncbi:MAG: hypothetical protein OXH59_17565 [Rhodospirillaceae bacterium]|nr:hypothetical protein [Rhodospirillaceae bacterium]